MPDNDTATTAQGNGFSIGHLASSIQYFLKSGSYFRRAVLDGLEPKATVQLA